MLHGECIAVGMVVEARIAARLGLADPDVAIAIARVLRAAGLPSFVPESMRAESVLDATRTDKKARAGVVEYALPAALGTMAGAHSGYAIGVPATVVLDAISASRATL